MTSTTPLRRALSAFLFAALFGLAGCSTYGHRAVVFEGDPDREAVLAVMERAFDAIAQKGEASAAIWREILLPEGSMSSVRVRDGARVIGIDTFEESLTGADAPPDAPDYLERIWEPTVLIDGDIAVAWARYDFWADGQLSHGGTDVCVLLRTDAGWRIASFAWTAERDAPPSPLGPLRVE